MKKVSLFLYFLAWETLVFAQRYTGWGRGVTWNDLYNARWIDSILLCIIVILLILILVIKVLSKLSNYLLISQKGIIPFIVFKGLKWFSITTVTDKETGEINKLCIFTNILGSKTFVAFSPYLGNVTLDEIKKKKTKFYIAWEKKGCYFLCTKETIRYKEENNDPYSGYHVFEDSLKSLLLQLNIEQDYKNLTFKNA